MELLSEIWKYILVFVLGAIPWIEIAVVIPVSIVAGMNPWLTGLMAFAGNLTTVYLVILFFDKFKQWRNRKKGGEGQQSKRSQRAVRLWNRYGLPGMSLLGPLLIGSHIAVFIAILFGAKKAGAMVWMTVSLAIWTIALTVASVYGFDLFKYVRG